MAHTLGENEGKSGVAGVVEDAARDLAAELRTERGGDQVDLFDQPEPLFAGPVRHVADTFERAAGRGRPKGSANKRTTAMRDYLLKRGYRHPMENLAAVANASVDELAKEWQCDRLDAAKEIVRANEALLPYFESKRPVEVDVMERTVGVLLVGEIAAGTAASDEFMSLTGIVADDE